MVWAALGGAMVGGLWGASVFAAAVGAVLGLLWARHRALALDHRGN